uniref:(California timema) hypothetical protein n=1 Tax=Timema californicum TaxID=61474 RepID=A0A7R9JIU1_TIMCA|nr:unnamed protein product [Timema californicum]
MTTGRDFFKNFTRVQEENASNARNCARSDYSPSCCWCIFENPFLQETPPFTLFIAPKEALYTIPCLTMARCVNALRENRVERCELAS